MATVIFEVDLDKIESGPPVVFYEAVQDVFLQAGAQVAEAGAIDGEIRDRTGEIVAHWRLD